LNPPAANNEVITVADGDSTTSNGAAASTSVRDNPVLKKRFKKKIRANFNAATPQTQRAYAGILNNLATGKACAAVDSIDDEAEEGEIENSQETLKYAVAIYKQL
jgi:hypothetical protein